MFCSDSHSINCWTEAWPHQSYVVMWGHASVQLRPCRNLWKAVVVICRIAGQWLIFWQWWASCHCLQLQSHCNVYVITMCRSVHDWQIHLLWWLPLGQDGHLTWNVLCWPKPLLTPPRYHKWRASASLKSIPGIPSFECSSKKLLRTLRYVSSIRLQFQAPPIFVYYDTLRTWRRKLNVVVWCYRMRLLTGLLCLSMKLPC